MDEQNLTGGSSEIKNTQGGQPQQSFSLKKFLSEQQLFVLLGLAVVVLAAVVGVGVYKVYAKTATDKFSLAIAKALNLPVVKVGNEKIPYVSYVEDLKAIHTMRDYDKAQRDSGATPDRSPGADLTEEQMTDQVLWRLVNNLLVEDAAKKFAVIVEDKDVKTLKAQMLQQFKDEAAANDELTKRYGWNMSVYEKKVMRPFILQTKLSQKIKDDTQTKADLKTEAEQVLEEVKNGADFAALAKKYNTDSTGERGGDLGWFGKGEMVPEFEKAAYSLKKGEVYPTLVESVYGYHIIQLTDRAMEKKVEKVRASQILFRFPDLLSYLDQAAKDGNIKLYLKVHNPFAELQSSTKK